MSALASYLALTKPRLLPLVLFSGLPALLLASGGWPGSRLALATLAGTAIAAAAANVLNSYLERDRDALMERTATRPLPSGALRPQPALVLGLLLSVVGTAVLWVWSSPAAALTAVAAILFYVFGYTLWLKPRSSIGVVVGGVSGAIAPLIADAAVDGRIGAAGCMLFSIIFVWQLPHFWTIALYRRDDYASAGFPTLVSRVGPEAARRRVLGWIVALMPFAFGPLWLGSLGWIYGVSATALGAWFVGSGVALVREGTDDAARRVFRVSLVYLAALFGAMIVDLFVSISFGSGA